jgi:ubiquinone/menaquinone biosynthesis C-methylase UbiE
MYRRTSPAVVASLIKMGNLSNSSKVLEVGSSSGSCIGELKSQTGRVCYGIDPSFDMLAIARKRVPSIDFKVGRGEKLEFDQNFFDLVFSVDVVHQISDRRAYFEEAFRVLDDEGKVCTVTDSEWIIRNRTQQSLYFPASVDVELSRSPKDGELRQIMEAIGFHDVSEKMVEYHYELLDLESYRSKVYSALLMISQEQFEAGIKRMEEDFAKGPIPCISRYLIVTGLKNND